MMMMMMMMTIKKEILAFFACEFESFFEGFLPDSRECSVLYEFGAVNLLLDYFYTTDSP